MLCCVTLSYFTLCYLCYVMFRYVTLCYVMLCYVIVFMLCYVMLCYVMLCYVMLYTQFTPCVGKNLFPNTVVNVEALNNFSLFWQTVIGTGWTLPHLVSVRIRKPVWEIAPSDCRHFYTVRLYSPVGCPHKMLCSNTAPKSKSSWSLALHPNHFVLLSLILNLVLSERNVGRDTWNVIPPFTLR
jgi:hypothetical protein